MLLPLVLGLPLSVLRVRDLGGLPCVGLWADRLNERWILLFKEVKHGQDCSYRGR